MESYSAVNKKSFVSFFRELLIWKLLKLLFQVNFRATSTYETKFNWKFELHLTIYKLSSENSIKVKWTWMNIFFPKSLKIK